MGNQYYGSSRTAAASGHPAEAPPAWPTFEEAVKTAAATGPRPGDCWWYSYYCELSHLYGNRILNAAYTRASVERFDDSNSACAKTRIPAPLALPFQFVVHGGKSVQIGKIEYRQGFPGTWLYYPVSNDYIALDSREGLQAHPNPEHGGPLLSLRDQAQLEILRLGDARLQQIVTATEQTLELQKQTAQQEERRLARLEAEEAEKKAEAEARKAKASSPIRILEETAEGAKDGAAASAFVWAADKLASTYSDHIPSILLTDRGRTATPWLLCVAAYLATLILPGFPLSEQLRAVSLRAARGTSTLMMAHLSGSIAPLMDRIIERGKTLLEKSE